MKALWIGVCSVVLAFAFTALAEEAAPAAPAAKMYYTCAKCCNLAMQAGKCATCGADMTQTHILAIKDGSAYCCSCGGDCKCEMKGDNLTKCGCGKPMLKVNLKGMYVCGCGPDCKCNVVADKAGKCGCGKDLKKVE